MRQTIQLLQLLIIVAAGYIFFKFPEDVRLYYVLGGMVATYILEKIDTLVLDDQKLKLLLDEQKIETASKKKKSTPINTLMESKNPKQLSKAIGEILKKFHIIVASPMQPDGVDLEFWAPGSDQVFGLKVLSSVKELEEELVDYDGLMAFNNAPDNKHRVVIVASNVIDKDAIDGVVEQEDFSGRSEDVLKQHQLLAMTTSTLRKIHLLCSKKGVKPKLFLQLFQKHDGGVFRLEDYVKK
jgi:hypothetical protein